MRKIITLAAAIVALAPLAAFAQTDGYYDRSYVRMSYVQGDVYVQRSGDLGYQAGEVNLVVIAGDKIGTRAGRLELQLGRQNYLRLDNDTVVEMAALPGADAQPTKIHLLSGSVFVRVNSLDGARNFEVHSPDASFYILAEGLYRLDVREGRSSALRVVEGEAEASGEQGSIVARGGESLVVADGKFVADGSVPGASGDDFRSWNDSRDAQFARPVQQSYLPAEYSEYETELADNGRWAYEADYGNVWVPRTTYVDWRPYDYGHWTWYPIIGWTWVSGEPWGWCTSHYGRWGWGNNLGWYWIPRHHWGWGPAWVHWYWDSSYIGWSPLSYWGYPCHLVGNRFYDRYMDYGFPRDSRSLMMVRRDQLQNRNLRGEFLGRDSLARVGRDNLRNGQPDLRPNFVRSGEIANRARGVLSGTAVRGVTRSFGAAGGRLAPESLRQNVIRRAETSQGLNRGNTGAPGGVNSGGRIIRHGGAPSEALSRPKALEPGGARSPSGIQETVRKLREFPSRQSLGGASSRSTESRVIGPGSTGRTVTERPSSSTARTLRTPSESPSTSSRILRSPSGTAAFPSRTQGSTSRSSGNTSSSSSRILRAPSGSGSSSPSIRAPRSLGIPGTSSTRSLSSSSRLSAPTRSSSGPAGRALSPSRSSGPTSRSMSAPSRSSGSSSRSVGSPSRSSSGSSSRSVSSSSRSSSSRSSGSVSRSSSGSSSRSAGSSGGGRIRK